MPVPLAIIWHQHQPYYMDLAAGEMVMPWVRLHGVKDYYGMARLLSEFPGVRCTINLVPSLVKQLRDIVENGVPDPFLRRTEINADALSADDACFILDHFFMANWERMIRVYPRYRQLLELRRPDRRTAQRAAKDFSSQDLRDLQVWFNLAWFHPVSFEESGTLRELLAKGTNFTEADKATVLKEQKQILARVIPLHKELAARHQVELTTSPFYHPILPLLCDMHSCLAAMPRNRLPNGHIPLPDDAEMQIKKAVEYHREVFGTAPEGMWPSEGAVSAEIVPLIARHGVRWIATDEDILGASLGTRLRNDYGKLERPDLVCRPWLCTVGGAKLNVLFRDHQLSDLIGFQYQSWDGALAADDLLARLQTISAEPPAGAETLVTVALDGENCWEHYPDQGVKFLRTLYGKLEKGAHNITTVRAGEFLSQHPPQRHVEKLFPGSWINQNFFIWVGHQEDRQAWEYLYRTRLDLLAATAGLPAPLPDGALAQAWEELYIAEGSDWFWWFGDDHTSGNDDAFDNLFRTHLRNVYRFLGQGPPFFLSEPIKGRGLLGRYTSPVASINPQIDGRCNGYFEWLGAGRYRADREGGVMTAANGSLVEQILFGYGHDTLFVRVDLRRGWNPKLAGQLDAVQQVALRFIEPTGLSLLLDAASSTIVFEGAWPAAPELKTENPPRVAAAWQEIIEFSIPFAALGLKENDSVAFYVAASAPNHPVERFPRSSTLQLTVPPVNILEHEWMV